MNAWRRERPWLWLHALGCLVLVATAVAAWVVGVRPTLAARHERAVLEGRLREARGVMDELDAIERSLDARLHESQRWLEERGLSLQPASQRSARLVVIADLAEQSRLTLDRLMPDEPRSQERFDIVTIRVGGSGTPESIEDFLGLLGETWRDMGVRRLSLTLRDAGSQARVGFEIELGWYLARADAIAAASP